VHKPTALAVASLHDIAEELVTKVLLAAAQAPKPIPPPTVQDAVLPRGARSDRFVLIGTSTGGPQALTRLLKALPGDFPAPIAIVLHIPAGYTAPLAERLNGECAIEVQEAQPGLVPRPGLAIIAQAGTHLRLVTAASGVVVRLDGEPRLAIHRPAVDVLFQSAAESLGKRVLGVVLTGMGDDGLIGARAVVAAGGQVLTEAESSCVVYGMPRVVKEAGLATAEAPLERMAAEIASRL
jgi:two-component system chemotaxis response regulator CheB